jgi:nucleoid-associated protein YgaU
MRTELKIGVTVLLVVTVMALVYFVFFAGDRAPKPGRESLGTIAASPDPNRSTAPRADRGLRGSRSPGRTPGANEPVVARGLGHVEPPASPSPSPLIPVASIAPITPAPTPSSRPVAETIATGEPRPMTPPAEIAVAPRPDRSPEPTLIPPLTATPSPRAAEPNRAAPSTFDPTPVYISTPPRVETIAPGTVDERPRLEPIRPGAVEANAATAARTGLIRKADGKDYYVVQKDDKGYWGIAEKPFVYGDGRKWDLIAKANPNADPARLQVNQELVIPPLVRVTDTRPITISSTRPSGTHGQYTIKAGDTLVTIAKSQYGDANLWQAIAKANPEVDPTRLKIGKDLVIPPLSEVRPGAVAPGATPAPTPSPSPSPTSRPAPVRHPAASPSPSPSPSPTERPATPTRTVPPGFD